MNKKRRLTPIIDKVKFIRRQEFPEAYLLDGCVCAMWSENLYKTKGIREAFVYLGKEIVPFFQEKGDVFSIEIDETKDVEKIRRYVKNKNEKLL